MHPIDQQLQRLHIALPAPSSPAGDYVPVIMRNGLIFVSGQLPVRNGEVIFQGQMSAARDIEQGRQAAALAAMNVLAQLRQATAGWQWFGSLLRVEGYIASAAHWYDQPGVLDAASKVFKQILGEQGVHTRAAFSSVSLPLNAMVELVVTAHTK